VKPALRSLPRSRSSRNVADLIQHREKGHNQGTPEDDVRQEPGATQGEETPTQEEGGDHQRTTEDVFSHNAFICADQCNPKGTRRRRTSPLDWQTTHSHSFFGQSYALSVEVAITGMEFW